MMPGTAEAVARINQGIALDADSPELTERDFRRAVPASAIVPDLASQRRVRPIESPDEEAGFYSA
ncbi:MAG: hypothetical protein LKI03_06440 [Acetobacter indonesiensis]|jgi:hypothetical protein|nr:hypothetical protein [Acetobacter indonesiensis]MCI1765669.1 hypothetical protein [Acetobacter indonesiensis]